MKIYVEIPDEIHRNHVDETLREANDEPLWEDNTLVMNPNKAERIALRMASSTNGITRAKRILAETIKDDFQLSGEDFEVHIR